MQSSTCLSTLKKEKEQTQRRSICAKEVEDITNNPFALHYRNYCNQAFNTTERANEPVDTATEQNHSGPAGQDIDESRLIWE